MEMEIADLGDVIVLRPGDELDLLGYQALSEKLEKLFHEGHKKIVLDLCRASYVNSSAAAALMRFREKARRSGGALVLSCVRGGASVAMNALGLLKTIDAYGNVEEAIAAIRRA